MCDITHKISLFYCFAGEITARNYLMARYVIQNRISDYRVVQLEKDLGFSGY